MSTTCTCLNLRNKTVRDIASRYICQVLADKYFFICTIRLSTQSHPKSRIRNACLSGYFCFVRYYNKRVLIDKSRE